MRKELKNNLINLPFFTIERLKIENNHILASLKYEKKKQRIISLKKGVYVFRDFLKDEKLKGNFETYLEFIANKLVEPSYLSLDYVLNKYSMITEAGCNLTSITTSTPRNITNQLSGFYYFSIKEPLFTGFVLNKKNNYSIMEASKAKALFDYLYFKKRGLAEVDPSFIEELRLNLDEMNNKDWEEFERYVNISKSTKMKKILKFLKK